MKGATAAECIAALWKLGPDGDMTILNAGGIVSRALQDIYPQLPPVLQNELPFFNGSIGRRCAEWPKITLWMQEFNLAEYDGSTFTRLRILCSSDLAEELLYRHGFSIEQRRDLPAAFCKAIQLHTTEVLRAS